jgi:non-specific serine/threonine protein kinase
MVACDEHDYPTAAPLLEESLALCRQDDDRIGVTMAVHLLGRVAHEQGDYARAAALFEEGLATSRELGRTRGEAVSLSSLGLVAQARRDWNTAAALAAESLRLRVGLRDRRGIAECLEIVAVACAAYAAWPQAARLLGAAAGLRASIAAPVPPHIRESHARTLATVRAALGARYDVESSAGRAMTLEEAVDEALGARPAAETAAPKRARWRAMAEGAAASTVAPLTPRERQVTALVARGLTNAQIAAELCIGTRTAETHVAAVLRKLGIASREQVGSWAIEQRLLPARAS